MTSLDKDVEDRLARLSPSKRALIERQLSRKPAGGIPRLPDNGSFVLSSAQSRLWFLDQFEPNSPLYNSPLLLRLRGNVDLIALQRALDTIVDRHETLRTVFEWSGDRPTQRPVDPFSVKIESIPSGKDDWVLNEARKPFDLGSGMLLRAALQQVDDECHLLLNIPHIAFDGWSRRLLRRDLASLYNHFSGIPGALPPALPIRYYDYAAWQQERLKTEEMRVHLDYWTRQLAGLSTVSAIATDFPRPPFQSYRGSQTRFHIPRDLVESVERLGQAHGATLFISLLAGFQALLYRYSGQTDIVVGTPISGRERPETEELIGCFVNTLALRTEFLEGWTVADLLRSVRATCLDAYDHQSLPFERLVEELHPERDLSRPPLVQVMLILQNTPKRDAEFHGLAFSSEEIHTGTSKLDLIVNFDPTDDGFDGAIEYSTDLFSEDTIARIPAHFERLLREIVSNPNQSVSGINLLEDQEKSLLINDWSGVEDCVDDRTSVPELFEEQVRLHPDDIAVASRGAEINYKALNARVNQLAHCLKKRGIGRESLVGLCLDRSIDMVVALLAIYKAGGAYLPIDPDHPKERIDAILEVAGVHIILSQDSLQTRIDTSRCDLFLIDRDWSAAECESETNPDYSVDADSSALAYVIYTSGSTGQPKGVEITRGSHLNLMLSMQSILAFGENDVLTSVSPITFDLSAEDMFLPLITGARLVVLDREDSADGRRLSECLNDTKTTFLQATPSTWRILIDSGWSGSKALKAVSGGDTMTPELAAALHPRCAYLWNGYGPTETTIWSTVKRIEKADDKITIGKPIRKTFVYILDSQLQPVPIGIVGEIYIAGEGVARGYRNQEDLTASRFLPNPFRNDAFNRMYRTGDLARWSKDGDIAFAGRADHQVKVRGYRIEIGEIESVLSSSPSVRKCAVLAREDTPGDQRIVAYIVPNPIGESNANELRAVTKQKLPAYMLPSSYIFLEDLPLNANGKLDRRALPMPDYRKAVEDVKFACPADSLEEGLCRLWTELLKINQVGVDDNFFELGGHSLLAVRLLARVQQEFETSLSLAEMFRASTVRSMAAIIRERRIDRAVWTPLVPLQPNGSRPPLFCAPVGGGSSFYYRALAEEIGMDQPFYAFEPIGMNGVDKPHETIEDMAAYYIEHLRAVQEDGPYYLCGLSLGGAVAFEMARRLTAAGKRVACLILFDTKGPGYSGAAATTQLGIHALNDAGFRIRYHLENLSAIAPKDRWSYVRSRLAKVREKENAAEPLPELFDEVRQAELRARRIYLPDRYPGKIHVLRARLQPPGESFEPQEEWRRFASEVEVLDTPGTHFTMLEPPCVRVAAKHVGRILQESG